MSFEDGNTNIAGSDAGQEHLLTNPFLEPHEAADSFVYTGPAPPTAVLHEYASSATDATLRMHHRRRAANEANAQVAARERRREELSSAVRQFYLDYPELGESNLRAVAAVESSYWTSLDRQSNVAKILRKESLPGGAAAQAFAAASILRQNPDGFTFDKLAPETLRLNRLHAWDYLMGNLQVLTTPDGIWDFTDRELSRYAGLQRKDLETFESIPGGLGHVPVVLATLAADMVHGERAPAFNIKDINRKLEAEGALIHAELQRYRQADQRLYIARRDNLSAQQRMALQEYRRRGEIERARYVRDFAERAVAEAARIRYGNNGSSGRLLSVEAECLVSEAHGFLDQDTPADVKDVLATRMADAARKCRIRSATELPNDRNDARRIYIQCMDHAKRLNYQPGSLFAWLGLSVASEVDG